MKGKKKLQREAEKLKEAWEVMKGEVEAKKEKKITQWSQRRQVLA